MSTLEKLFVQIFDRKNWIVDQLKQQKDLYDQYLASNLLINGVRPPPWLLGTGFQAGSADLNELKKEELISGLLFPPSRPNISFIGGHSNHCNRPIITANNGQVSDAVFTETCSSNKYLNVGEVSTLVPKCHLNDNEFDLWRAMKEVPELDNIITSPQDQIETVMPDIHFDPDQSLARIQRSRSRQKALELRNSGKANSKKRSLMENYTGAYTGRVTRSRTCKVLDESLELHNFSTCTKERGYGLTQSRSATQQLNSVDKPMESPNFVSIYESDDDLLNAPETQELAQSSRSGQKDLGCIESKTEKCLSMGDIKGDGSHVGKVTSLTAQLVVNCAEELLGQDDSSKNLGYRVMQSSSASIKNSSKVVKLFDGVEGYDILKQSVSQLITAPHNDVGGVVQQDGCSARILETKLVSNAPVEALSTNSGCNLVSGLEVGTVNLPSDNHMLLEPKLLVFDETENCNLNNTSTPLDKEKQESSPETNGRSIKAAESLRKQTTPSDIHEQCGLSVNEQFLEKDRAVEGANSGRNRKASSDYDELGVAIVLAEKSELDSYHKSISARSSNSPPLLSRRVTLKTYDGMVADKSPEKEKISKQGFNESLENVTILSNLRAKCNFSVDDQLLEKDQTVGILNNDGTVKPVAGNYLVDKSDDVSTDKAKLNCSVSTNETSITPALSAMKRAPESYEEIISHTNTKGYKSSQQDPIESLKNVSRSNDTHGKCGLPVEMELLERLQTMEGAIGEEYQGASSETHGEERPKTHLCAGLSTGKRSNFSLLSPRNGTSEIYEDFIGKASQESSKLSKKSLNSLNHLSAGQVSTRSPLAPSTTQMHNIRRDSPYFLRSYTCHNVNVKSNGSYFANKATNLTNIVNCGSENSWPVYKRRKIDGKSSDLFATSPRLKQVKPCNQTVPVLDFHHFPIPDTEVSFSNVSVGPSVEKCPSTKCLNPLSPKLQLQQVEQDMEVGDQDAKNLLGLGKTKVLPSFDSSINKETHCPQGCVEDNVEVVDHDELAPNLEGQFSSEGHQKYMSLECTLNIGSMEQICFTEGTREERKSNIGDPVSYCSVGSPHNGDLGPIVTEQHLPEFEGFSIGAPTGGVLPCIAGDGISWDKLDLPSSTSARISILEQLCRSTSMLTPLPSSKTYKLHSTPDLYKSLPNVLERMDLRDTVLFSNDDIERLKASYNFIDVEANHSNCCDHMSSSSVQFDSDARKPSCTPPVRKLCQRITSCASGHSSEIQRSMNPELTCFRIDEDTSTSEEYDSKHEVFDPLQKEDSPREKHSATNRGPLIDKTNMFNPCASISVTQKFHDRGSTDSVNTELNFNGTQLEAKQKPRNGYGRERRSKNKDKENQNSSVGVNGSEKNTELLRNRFSRSKLSGKAAERKGNPSFLDKGYKHNNIVSNVSSFIPLVQQKHQSAAVYTGKRDIKVKALEVAEATKRLEEKRENDRKLKKEAAKLERTRLEQEKLRQLELQQKKKEEQRKKKEADMVARKRLREEEERKEKERKRRCVEEARRQQKELEEKLRAEREEREQQRKTAGEREAKRKALQIEERNHQRTEKGNELADSREKINTDTGTSNIPVGGALKEHEFLEDFASLKESYDKVAINFYEANEDGVSITEASREQSYEISPYKDSDDEEEEEDELPNNKFIPSWARGKNLTSALPFTQQVEPCEIFTPERNCSIMEFFFCK